MKLPKILREAILISTLVLIGSAGLHAGNEVLGEIRFVGFGKPAKTSGVWIDGQYVGYLGELKGSKKVLLLPGEHEVSIRQAGYKDLNKTIVLNPADIFILPVEMERDTRARYAGETASLKLSVRPNRAAVFVDGMFVGHVDEFDGPYQAQLLAPGEHLIEISLPGYKTFRTRVTLLPHQKFELKTDLFPGSILEADSRIVEKGRAESR